MAGKRKKASRQRLTPRLSFAAPAQPEKDGSQKWRRSGTGGTSESTKTNASLATEYLDHFLKLKCHEFTVATSEEFGHIICDISLIQEFATFMSEAARTKKVCSILLFFT
ncbi:hypothetical protein B7Y94_05550 [Candidatus Saccharibacteria bacterium 32-49-12]|nr:MAG: hypothetical protein B7Y94_05550 [Candidatus Saccharibacteria bacterium 32-49-12]